MKFVDEGLKVRIQHLKKRNCRIAKGSSASDTDAQRAAARTKDERTLAETAESSLGMKQPSYMKAQRDQILSSFVSALFPLGSAEVQTSFLGSWLWHLPPRLGNSVVLDHAALSVAWAYFARMFGDRSALRNAEFSYSCAIKNLSLALSDTSQQFTSNVLCSTILLGHYEVCSVSLLMSLYSLSHL